MNSLNTETDIDDSMPTQGHNQKSLDSVMATPISINSIQRYNIPSRMDTKSMRSSDNSSGNGSDVELLSSKKSKSRKQQQQQYSQMSQQSNYYEISQNVSSKSDSRKQRSMDQVPKELRNSKQSFQQAMEKPCEFFVDVM